MSQDIRVGDVLIGDDGTRRTVLETFGGEDELYRVDQKRGISYVVNSKHKLLFKYSGEGVVQSGDRSKVIWFDREQTVPRSKQFDTREDGYAYFSDLRLSDAIEMTVDEYIKTKDGYKKSFVAWKAPDVHWDGKARKACAAATPNKDELATGFSVTPIGRGRYFGWTVDGNRRFVLGDFTVVRNCDQASVFGCLHVAHGCGAGADQPSSSLLADVVHTVQRGLQLAHRRGGDQRRHPQ